ncbi:hypothetical protein OG320_26785 [Microbispora sp. NBC_01189]|uniref:hypothetical protein n=1 Tax=unclassified Microbispora TaxID=2614687 RepID=UPI002E15CCA8|nr:hypothetical protein OG320_26785 [Microbispora sp. NBC_01189]
MSPVVRYLLVAWSDVNSRTPLRWIQVGVNNGTASLALNAGKVATLMAIRVDTLPVSVDASSGGFDTSVDWSASLPPKVP